MKFLRSIPFEGWTDEVNSLIFKLFFLYLFLYSFFLTKRLTKVERFLVQMRNDTTALSGVGFFVMT